MGLTFLLATPAVIISFFAGRIFAAWISDRMNLKDGSRTAVGLAGGLICAILCLVIVRTTLLPATL